LKKGVNPRKNRSIPPINYERVYNIKQNYPELKIIINGEVNNPTDVINHLKNVDGVMIGRAVCNNPFLLNEIDILIHNEARVDKEDILKEYFKYIINNFKNDVKITDFTKHLSCIFKGYIGSKHTRAYMCHELNYEKEPVKKLEELIFKEDLWKNGQDSITTVI
jgi:tRNA-dihydrouridine synthase A